MRPSTADDVLDLMDVSFHSAALGAALELAIPLKRCHYWLQLLAQIGLIEEDP